MTEHATSIGSRLPPGLPQSLDVPAVDVGAVLRGAAARYGDRVAYHHGGSEVSYRQLLADASQVAHGLRARGVQPGDVVAVHLPNCLRYPAVYYGILLAGRCSARRTRCYLQQTWPSSSPTAPRWRW